MATKHQSSPGVVLDLSDGSSAHGAINFEQEISIDPITSKPISGVTALSVELIVLGADGVRRRTILRPLPDGSGVKVLGFHGNQFDPAADLDIEFVKEES